MTIQYGRKIVMLTTAAVIGFAAFSSLYPPNVYASDRHHEREVYNNIEASQHMAKEIEERQRNTMSELERLKAQTQVRRESIVDTITGPQSYFEDMVMPKTTNEAPDGKETKRVYKYDENTGATVPQRLFNNVR